MSRSKNWITIASKKTTTKNSRNPSSTRDGPHSDSGERRRRVPAGKSAVPEGRSGAVRWVGVGARCSRRSRCSSISVSEAMSPPPSRSNSRQGMPAASCRGDVLLRRVADVKRLARLAAGELERRREDRRIGLSRSRSGRGDDAVEGGAETAALEHLGQRDVPVGDADERQRALAQRGQRRAGVGSGLEADRRPSSSAPTTSRSSSNESRSAQRARSSASDASSTPSWACCL